jgi:hypothetical protein
MRYTVVWDPDAQDDLARIWMQAHDPQAVADASDQIDRLLKTSALTVGEDYGPDRRLIVEPLEVIYSVSPDDCLVQVLQVALFA